MQLFKFSVGSQGNSPSRWTAYCHTKRRPKTVRLLTVYGRFSIHRNFTRQNVGNKSADGLVNSAVSVDHTQFVYQSFYQRL